DSRADQNSHHRLGLRSMKQATNSNDHPLSARERSSALATGAQQLDTQYLAGAIAVSKATLDFARRAPIQVALLLLQHQPNVAIDDVFRVAFRFDPSAKQQNGAVGELLHKPQI